MTLKGKGKVHIVDNRAYIYVPVKVAADSQFPIKDKQIVEIRIENKKIIISGD